MGYNGSGTIETFLRAKKKRRFKMTDEKKNIFDKIVDSLTDRDEKEAAAKAAAEKQAAEISASVKAAADKAAAEKAVAAAKLATEKAATETKAAAEKAAAEAKAAAEKAAAEKARQQEALALQAKIEKMAADKAAAMKAAAPKKGIVTVRSLRVRKEHSTDSLMVAGLVDGNEVTIYETWTDGKDTWARIGPDQWAAMVYNGETYIKLAE
jgi:hypothetical protein